MRRPRPVDVCLGVLLAAPLALSCAKFNGPANPPDAPWPVVCEGGGRCMVDYECRPGGRCRPGPGPFGAARGDAGALLEETPQRFE